MRVVYSNLEFAFHIISLKMTSSEHGACILAPIQLWESFTFQPRLVVCELRNYQ